jgi:PIN domain nuclease of toxin-antitoxin system
VATKPSLPSGKILVDASLLIGIIDSDPDACLFIPILSRCVATSINFGETLYKLEQLLDVDPQKVESAFVGFGLQIDSFGLSAARYFNKLKKIDESSRNAQVGAGVAKNAIRSLSLADLTCLSYSLDAKLPILTGDKHWCTLGPYGFEGTVFDFRSPATTF